MTETELKDCPFCGGIADIRGEGREWFVVCTDGEECGAEGHRALVDGYAIERWNTRVTRASVSEATKAERSFCDFPSCGCSMGAMERCKHPPRAALSAALASTAETVEPVAWTRQRSLDRLEEHGMIIAISGPGPDDAYDVPLYTRPPARRETWEEAAKFAEAEMAAVKAAGCLPQALGISWVVKALRARATEERDDG